jgi:hypothetical protein
MKREQRVNIRFLVKLKKTASYVRCMKKTAELLAALAQNYFRGYSVVKKKGPYGAVCGKYFEGDNM